MKLSKAKAALIFLIKLLPAKMDFYFLQCTDYIEKHDNTKYSLSDSSVCLSLS